jgi:hypothetical protein
LGFDDSQRLASYRKSFILKEIVQAGKQSALFEQAAGVAEPLQWKEGTSCRAHALTSIIYI